MKNLKYTQIILAVATVLLISSCENFIDLQPLDQISMDDYWKTSTDLENYMLQFYPTLPSSIIVDADMNSDNMLTSSPNTILNGERTLRTGNWKNEWSNLRNVNIFLENYGKCESEFDEYKHFLGEAYFFRAWYYFDLLQKYGDLPWYSKALQLDDEDELMKPREPRTLIADSILVDLDKALLYLNTREEAGNNRINKEASLALKTRVALYEGTWQKYHANTPFGTSGANPDKYFQACVDAAEELMDGSYSVGVYNTGKPSEDYYKMFGFDNMSDVNEVLFYKAYNADEGMSNSSQYRLVKSPTGSSATMELISSYLGKNGEPYDYIEHSKTNKGNDFLTKIAEDCDPRLKSSIWIPGDVMASVSDNIVFSMPNVNGGALELVVTGFQIKKSSNPESPAAGKMSEGRSETGHIYFRYGEVLLNYAEAKYELDNTIAYAQLNLLRERAGMPDFAVNPKESDYSPVDYGYSVSDELYEIRRERRVELALEGFREMDFMRWAAHSLFKGKRLKGYPFNSEEFPDFYPTLDENGLIDYLSTQLPNGYQFRESQDYLYSIPQDEITLNPNLEQNPGW
ncbi:RagB/SusD family nutrient uptake outer membrane protein [Maribellus comscasis]|uniref:RagB/SusD family nutrient uptake outer membrane protein n=1 Tax=Maribellus comscasis TaxID=2681766 RepID=A0A6I6JZA7_9BACT|nr:RagB/SusD family nutrient uptake outer membrane protein [Maribellus comscasis]QGY47931.1 RagB/SusD family nutrient uptake outer membrane protein [Maribellus comscasis]